MHQNVPTRPFAVAVALAFVLAAFAPLRAAGEIIEQVLVKVNGDILTKTELEQRQVAAIRQRTDSQAGRTTPSCSKAIDEVTPQILVDAVDEYLLSAARARSSATV